MADKTIIRHPSTLSRHISLAKTFFHPPERVGTLGYASLPTLSGRWKRAFARDIYLYSIPAILSPCLQMETQPRCIPRYFCNKVERICAIYLISTLADCTLPLWKNDIFTLSFSLRECRNTMYFHTSIALLS